MAKYKNLFEGPSKFKQLSRMLYGSNTNFSKAYPLSSRNLKSNEDTYNWS